MLPTVRRTIQLHPAQRDFRESLAPYRGFVGGRGAGKTWVGSYDVVRRAKRGRLYLVASPTYTVLADTTFRTFCGMGRDLGLIGAGDVRVQPPSVRLSTGAEVIFRSADDPERLRGPNLSGAWLDEASLMSRDAYNVVIACLREAGEQGWLSATFTPKGLSHWTYEIFGKRAPDTEIFHARTRDNPFNPPGFQDRLAKQYAGILADQELDGRFVNVDGAEFPGEWFADHIWAAHWPERFSWSAMALDPSKGRSDKFGDYRAYVFAGETADGIIWIDADLARQPVAQIVDDGFRLFRAWQPMALAIEVNQFQELLASEFLRLSRERRLVLPLFGVTNTVNKQVRIRDTGRYLAQGRLRFRPDSPGAKLLVNQLRDFPGAQHDDGPDALEMALRMLDHLKGIPTAMGQPELLRA